MDNVQVYLGVWTNWSRGAVMGATLTTTRNYGNLLIAFTAFFIPLVATRFWRICCFFLHRIHSTAEPKGALHHQRQVLLRNAASMESALVTLFSLTKKWHARKHAKLTALLPLFGFTIITIAAFTVAGGFSSRISSAMSDEVLINGNNCGISLSAGPSMDTFESWTRYLSRTYTDAANYAQQCYSEASSGMPDCDRFVVKELQTANIETNRSCPFPGDICRTNNTNIRLDTGYLDSHDHLGINAPPSERFGYRFVLECAPLKTKGRVTYVNLDNTTWARYHYGDQNMGGADSRKTVNFTYEVEDLSFQYPKDYAGAVRGDFRLNVESYSVINGEIVPDVSSFIPIPELIRTDAEVSIVFLSGNGVLFYDPVDDYWYRATAEGKNMTSQSLNGTHQLYQPVDAASPMGCVEQWQWCNSNHQNEDDCGPLTSQIDSLYGASHLFNISGDVWLSERPVSNTSIGSHFVWPAMVGGVGGQSLEWVIRELKSSVLASRSSSYSGIQYALPTNQWHLDVQGWWNAILAKTQANMVNAAIGLTDYSLRGASWTPDNQYEQNVCYNQKIRSANYTSFSLFGLYFTYITGALIVLVSLILEPFFGCLHDRARYKQYEHLEWTTNETLQLHRLAHEGAGSKSWSGCTESAPTTLPEANLASLDIEDLTHPVLAQPVKIEEEVVAMTEGVLNNTDMGSNVGRDITVGKPVINVAETSEVPTGGDLIDNIGHDSSDTTMGRGSRESLQSTLSAAHSLSINDAASFETQESHSVSPVSPNEHREEHSG